MKWIQTDLGGALKHASGKTVVGSYDGNLGWPDGSHGVWSDAGVVLSDGSIVVGSSYWTGPYSDVTPDTEAQEPRFWLGTTVEQRS